MSITASLASGDTLNNASTITRSVGTVTNGDRIVVCAVKAITTASNVAFVAGDCTKNAGTATIGAVTLDVSANRLTGGSSYIDVGIWSAPITGGGTLTMQVTDGTTSTANLYWDIMVLQVHSSLGATTVGSTNSGNAASGAPNSGSVTPANYEAILVGVAANNQGTSTAYTQDSNFTSIYENPNGNLGQSGEAIYRIIASGSDDANWTAPAGSDEWVAAVVAYLEPSGAGSSSVSPSVSLSISPSSSVSSSASLSVSPSSSVSSSPSPSAASLLIVGRVSLDYD